MIIRILKGNFDMSAKEFFSQIPCLKGEHITLRRLTLSDADDLRELTEDDEVYRYLPTLLYERKHDALYVIEHLYDECIEESLILGIFEDGEFCGLVELYGFIASQKKVSVGCRLLKKHRGRGAASEVISLLYDYLIKETEIKTMSASSMLDNKASANALTKNGFICVEHAVPEDWGYDLPTLTDKWILQ